MLHKTSKLELRRKRGISVPPPAVLHVEKKKKNFSRAYSSPKLFSLDNSGLIKEVIAYVLLPGKNSKK